MTRHAYRIGYATAGLAHHRLENALELVAELGYCGVFLTLDVHHLDPYDAGLAGRVAAIGALLRKLDLAVVVETGARFLLDPRRKHWPTLISNEGAERREDFLRRAITIARDLGAGCVSLWSGANHDRLPRETAMGRLAEALDRLLPKAEAAGVDLAFEPEPGMLVETVGDFAALRGKLGAPSRFKLSLDCGHLLVTGEGAPDRVLLQERALLGCVAIEDMRRGVHEHLPFGAGDLDLPSLVRALGDSGFTGVVAVELGRHSHDGPAEAARAKAALLPLGVPFRTP